MTVTGAQALLLRSLRVLAMAEKLPYIARAYGQSWEPRFFSRIRVPGFLAQKRGCHDSYDSLCLIIFLLYLIIRPFDHTGH